MDEQQVLVQALHEDIQDGDVTTRATIPQSKILRGTFLVKESGIISGLSVVKQIFLMLDKQSLFHAYIKDGASVQKGQTIAEITGKGRAILSGERTALNFLQRMSGIATVTRYYVEAVKGTKAIILDTRKTVPGLRYFDKQAVRDGGGKNHRFGLFDMYLVKDNHIAAAGSITKAMHAIRKVNRKNLLIEVEVTNKRELLEAIETHPDRIMLDNMDLAAIRNAVGIVHGRIPLEVSGGVDLESVTAIAQTGVDYISIGRLTHSVKALDISLEITK